MITKATVAMKIKYVIARTLSPRSKQSRYKNNLRVSKTCRRGPFWSFVQAMMLYLGYIGGHLLCKLLLSQGGYGVLWFCGFGG